MQSRYLLTKDATSDELSLTGLLGEHTPTDSVNEPGGVLPGETGQS